VSSTKSTIKRAGAPLPVGKHARQVADDIIAGRPVTNEQAWQAARPDVEAFYVYLRAHGLHAAGTGVASGSDLFTAGPVSDSLHRAAGAFLADASRENERAYYRVLARGR
jgi:hypothetical protein